MKKQFVTLQATRQNLLKLAANLSLEQLNTIPSNFNNNIIWNLGHVVVTQQLLCYRMSDLPCQISDEMIEKYRKGSSPQGQVGEAEYQQIKELMFSMIDRTQADYEQGLFQTYKVYKTSYNVTLESFEDAFQFNNLHEGMHLGFCIGMKKLL